MTATKLRWKQTKNTEAVSVWESHGYTLRGFGHRYGNGVRRTDWRIEVGGVEIGSVGHLDAAKNYASVHLDELKPDVADLIGIILHLPGHGEREWHPVRFQVVREWGIDQGLIQRYKESTGYPVELIVTDAGKTWYADQREAAR